MPVQRCLRTRSSKKRKWYTGHAIGWSWLRVVRTISRPTQETVCATKGTHNLRATHVRDKLIHRTGLLVICHDTIVLLSMDNKRIGTGKLTRDKYASTSVRSGQHRITLRSAGARKQEVFLVDGGTILIGSKQIEVRCHCSYSSSRAFHLFHVAARLIHSFIILFLLCARSV